MQYTHYTYLVFIFVVQKLCRVYRIFTSRKLHNTMNLHDSEKKKIKLKNIENPMKRRNENDVKKSEMVLSHT